MKRVLFSRAFWLDAAERSIKTAAQFAVGTGLLGRTELIDGASVSLIAAAAATGAVLSLLTSVASAPVSGMSPASVAPPGA